MSRLIWTTTIVASAVVAGCLASHRPYIQEDEDGCRVVLEEELAYLDDDLAQALRCVMDADSVRNANRSVSEFLLLIKKKGPSPEAFCLVKAALFDAPGVRVDAYDLWAYWTTGMVLADNCSTGAYNAAKKHFSDLILFSEACGDIERARVLERNMRMLDAIRTDVAAHQLCLSAGP